MMTSAAASAISALAKRPRPVTFRIRQPGRVAGDPYEGDEDQDPLNAVLQSARKHAELRSENEPLRSRLPRLA